MSNRRVASISLSADVLAWLMSRGHSQADIARMLGVSQGYISLVKSRERALTLDHLSALADAMKVPLGAMMLQVSPPPARMNPETAALFEVTEKLIRKADAAAAAIREHLAAAGAEEGVNDQVPPSLPNRTGKHRFASSASTRSAARLY